MALHMYWSIERYLYTVTSAIGRLVYGVRANGFMASA